MLFRSLGQKLFPDVHGLLVQSGLRLFDLQRSFWKRNATGEFPSEKGRLLFANALYLKEPEDVVLQFCGDDEKLVRAALVYHAFHYGDLLRTLHDLVPVEHKMKLDVLASSLGRSKPSGTNRIPASFDLLRRKTHGLLARIERVCGTLRKSIYGHTDHFGSCDSTLGN